MNFPTNFICASEEYSSLQKQIPAPYIRRSFDVPGRCKRASLCITGLGFYEAYINGENITKGALAPYRSNLDDIIYYDIYDISDKLRDGKNTLGIILGNGMRNALGAYTWDFDKARFRGAPATAFCVEAEDEDGVCVFVESDENAKTAPSPIFFDDLHFGEYYDARAEIKGWNLPEFDDSEWRNVIVTEAPRGEARLCEAEPIVQVKKLKPVSVTKHENGYVYDFGCNVAGVCTLRIKGERGQRVVLRHFEAFHNGKPQYEHFRYGKDDRVQEDEYILCGDGEEEYTPRFTYHGFRYVFAEGISEEQATEQLLSYIVLSSDLKKAGEFWCSSETVNKIQEATLNSDIANFYYFPTDCPQREKNGWSADASLSAEQMLFNFTPERSYREWMRNIYKTLTDCGQLPGIIPTTGWGYHWGNGPAWDSVIVNLPYYTYIYRGDREILEELASPLKRYLDYLRSKRNEKGLIEIGLGDWCQPNTEHSGAYKTPLAVTDTVISYDIAKKAEFIYGVLGKENEREFACDLADSLRASFREHLLDRKSAVVYGETQSAQAMAIYYGMLEDDERSRALDVLLRYIEEDGGHFNTGVLGGRVIFRVLAENAHISLAYSMITRDDHPLLSR